MVYSLLKEICVMEKQTIDKKNKKELLNEICILKKETGVVVVVASQGISMQSKILLLMDEVSSSLKKAHYDNNIKVDIDSFTDLGKEFSDLCRTMEITTVHSIEEELLARIVAASDTCSAMALYHLVHSKDFFASVVMLDEDAYFEGSRIVDFASENGICTMAEGWHWLTEKEPAMMAAKKITKGQYSQGEGRALLVDPEGGLSDIIDSYAAQEQPIDFIDYDFSVSQIKSEISSYIGNRPQYVPMNDMIASPLGMMAETFNFLNECVPVAHRYRLLSLPEVLLSAMCEAKCYNDRLLSKLTDFHKSNTLVGRLIGNYDLIDFERFTKEEGTFVLKQNNFLNVHINYNRGFFIMEGDRILLSMLYVQHTPEEMGSSMQRFTLDLVENLLGYLPKYGFGGVVNV